MSNEAARGTDPRFDPRFQRGYVPDAAASVSDGVARDPHPVAGSRPLIGAPAPAEAEPAALHPAAGAAVVEEAQTDDHAAALLAYFGPDTGAVRAPRPVGEPDPVGTRPGVFIGPPPPRTAAEHAESGMHASSGGFVVEPEPESESPFVRHPSLRYWVSLAASIAFVLFGLWLYWTVNLDQMSGMVSLGVEQQAMYNSLQSLASGLMMSGALGTVLVLGLWAVQAGRGARS
ncbi:hypothetical protein BJ978_000763 [Agromyces terreus]|uniref:Uncharacterized protein n=1 Tax=Agromyces terreus TaxID=424795 RepID=A0A9X2GWQ9_9MICO|nr:hypothetical protein [Agromyces terreus]MCP2370087.1 hypothetical protein [Agromyces terreus]